MILYSRLRTGIPLRSKLLHCRKRWWKHATHTTARPRSSNFVFFPCNSASTGKNGPLGCAVANNRFSKPFVELLQNVQRVNVSSPLVEGSALVFSCEVAMLFIRHLLITQCSILCTKLQTSYTLIYTRISRSWSSKPSHFNIVNRIKTPVIH